VNPDGADRRAAALWASLGFVVIFFVGSALHFTFELSGYQTWVAVVSAVNESTWEHLKMFYFPAVVFALVQHAWLRDKVHNYWYGVGVGILTVPVVISVSFYTYLGILLPRTGKGTLALDIGTAVLAVAVAQVATYRVWVAEPRPVAARRVVGVLNAALLVAMLTFTFLPPRVFLFEDFYGYTYNGEFGILESYEGREVFVQQDLP
jgi:hypothetical protein